MPVENRRSHIHQHPDIGAKIADKVASIMGSWRFIIVQTVIVAIWIISNVWLLTHPFDPYPLILLNLVFSTQAAYSSPLILMSQNRQATKDRVRDDTEAFEVDQLVKNQEELKQINLQQLSILQEQKVMKQHQEELIAKVDTLLALVETRQVKIDKYLDFVDEQKVVRKKS